MKRVSHFSLILAFFASVIIMSLISIRAEELRFQLGQIAYATSRFMLYSAWTLTCIIVKLTCRHCIEGKEGLCNMCLYCTRKTIVKRVFNLFLSSPLWASLSGQVAQAQIRLYLVTHYTLERHITVPVTKSG